MKLSTEDKHIAEMARKDWQEQCKRAMQGVEFTDKSARACFLRIKAQYTSLKKDTP